MQYKLLFLLFNLKINLFFYHKTKEELITIFLEYFNRGNYIFKSWIYTVFLLALGIIHKTILTSPMSVLLIILYTWTMLLHQNFTVTTSKPVYPFFCYHIKW